MADKDNSLRATHVWGAAGIVVAGLLWLATVVLDNRYQILDLKEDIVEVKGQVVEVKGDVARNREAIVALTNEFIAFREEVLRRLPPPPPVATPSPAAPAEPKVSKIR